MKIFDSSCLSGGTYLVTGASSGIGSAVAKSIAACGGRVILGGRDEARITQVFENLDGTGHLISLRSLNDADTAFDWVKEVSTLCGPLSGVFHSAGAELILPIKLIKQRHLNDVMGSSVMTAFGIARAAANKNVLIDGASLVFMSSVAGSQGQVGLSAYSAAKAAIDGMVRSLACDFASRKIRVNSIVSGAVKTSMHDRLTKGNSEDIVAAYEKMHLLGFGEVSDIANAALFLLSDASRWITGTTLSVDGGYRVR